LTIWGIPGDYPFRSPPFVNRAGKLGVLPWR